MKNYDICIVGAGPGGIFSAYELCLKAPTLRIAVIEKGTELSKRHCPIDGKKITKCIHCKSCSIMNGFGGAGAFSDGKYNITNNADGTKGIELANNVIQEGTNLNKFEFDKLKKINTIIGYHEVIGEWNPATEILNYTLDVLMEEELLNNQRVLLQCVSSNIPATDFNVIKSSTNIGNYYRSPQLIEMSNGNIMIVGNDGDTSYTGYITILDQSGNVVKSSTSIGDYNTIGPQLIEMSNGNIMVVGNYNLSDYNGYIIILDQQGYVVKSKTSIGDSFYTPQLIEMSNGNIMIVGTFNGSPYNGYYFICEPIAANASASLNNVPLDTILKKNLYYELVYKEEQDKFICEEVRNDS